MRISKAEARGGVGRGARAVDDRREGKRREALPGGGAAEDAPSASRASSPSTVARKSVYHREVPTRTIDVYRVLLAFEVTDPCIAHAVKKLLVPGKRSGGKTMDQDVSEAVWSLNRFLEMRAEESGS